MNIDPRMMPAALAGLVLLSGCTPVDAGMGNSVRTNMAVQTIDPAPVYEDEFGPVSGEKMAKAVERYRKDQVKKPQGIKTTSGGASSK